MSTVLFNHLVIPLTGRPKKDDMKDDIGSSSLPSASTSTRNVEDDDSRRLGVAATGIFTAIPAAEATTTVIGGGVPNALLPRVID